MTKKYGPYWDKFYENAIAEGKPLWDVDPEEAVIADLEIFKTHFDCKLPLVDVGCGTGQQTWYLSGVYERVLGVDVSAEAIEHAKKNYTRPGLDFDVMDVSSSEHARKIYDQLGDANIYIRGVLHQLEDQDREGAIDALSNILGRSGHLFLTEVSTSIKTALEKDAFSDLPPGLRKVFISHLPPKGMELDQLKDWFPSDRFEILESGETSLVTNLEWSPGQRLLVPAIYALIGINK